MPAASLINIMGILMYFGVPFPCKNGDFTMEKYLPTWGIFPHEGWTFCLSLGSIWYLSLLHKKNLHSLRLTALPYKWWFPIGISFFQRVYFSEPFAATFREGVRKMSFRCYTPETKQNDTNIHTLIFQRNMISMVFPRDPGSPNVRWWWWLGSIITSEKQGI